MDHTKINKMFVLLNDWAYELTERWVGKRHRILTQCTNQIIPQAKHTQGTVWSRKSLPIYTQGMVCTWFKCYTGTKLHHFVNNRRNWVSWCYFYRLGISGEQSKSTYEPLNTGCFWYKYNLNPIGLTLSYGFELLNRFQKITYYRKPIMVIIHNYQWSSSYLALILCAWIYYL